MAQQPDALRWKRASTCLFHKDKIYSCNQTAECCKVVPLQALALEEEGREDGEDQKGDNLLNDLQLHECEGTSVACEAYAVGWNLT